MFICLPLYLFSIGPITFTFNGHGYFYSGDVEAHSEDKVDWLEARNICREYCMDLVSIETPSENDLIEELIAGGNDKIMDTQCGNYKIFLSLRFCVKSNFAKVESANLLF